MQAAVEANVAYQARNDPEYQQLVAQQQEMRGPEALSAMQVGQASLPRPLCLHVEAVAKQQEVRHGSRPGVMSPCCKQVGHILCLPSPVCTMWW